MIKVDKYRLEKLLSGNGSSIDLFFIFKWNDTPQGGNFWENEHMHLLDKHPLSHEAMMYLTVLNSELENEDLLSDHENVIT